MFLDVINEILADEHVGEEEAGSESHGLAGHVAHSPNRSTLTRSRCNCTMVCGAHTCHACILKTSRFKSLSRFRPKPRFTVKIIVNMLDQCWDQEIPYTFLNFFLVIRTSRSETPSVWKATRWLKPAKPVVWTRLMDWYGTLCACACFSSSLFFFSEKGWFLVSLFALQLL